MPAAEPRVWLAIGRDGTPLGLELAVDESTTHRFSLATQPDGRLRRWMAERWVGSRKLDELAGAARRGDPDAAQRLAEIDATSGRLARAVPALQQIAGRLPRGGSSE